MVKDLVLKKVIIECELDAKLRSLSRNVFKEYGKESIAELDLAIDIYQQFKVDVGKEVFRVIENLNRAFYRRRKKCKERIEYMITTGNCIFLTFTFTDDVLQRTLFDSRRQAVRRFCSQYNCLYVGNIDFGVKDEYIDKLGVSRKGTHREHYHVVMQAEEVDYKAWKLGALNGIKVRKVEDSQAIATYITKLTNHAVKSSTMNCEDLFKNRVIYSKLWKEVSL